MKKYLLPIMLIMTIFTFAHARKPAVEPVSGVETESYNATAVGVEVQYNFGNHIMAQSFNKNPSGETPAWVAGITLLSFIMLPFLMWFFINKSTDIEETIVEEATQEITHQTYADTIDQENVASLSDHRKDHKEKDKKAA